MVEKPCLNSISCLEDFQLGKVLAQVEEPKSLAKASNPSRPTLSTRRAASGASDLV